MPRSKGRVFTLCETGSAMDDDVRQFREIVARIEKAVREREAAATEGRQPRKARAIKAVRPRRDLKTQLEEVIRRKGLRKKDIAAEMGIHPTYLPQLFKRGLSAKQIEQVSDAVGVVPQYFDEYVSKMACAMLRDDAEFLAVTRAYLFDATPKERRDFLQAANTVLQHKIGKKYL
jgi:AraC-like DNA-binding protein